MMRRLVYGSVSDAQSIEWVEEDYFWEAAAAKKEDVMSVVPIPVSSAAYVGSITFVAWAVQGPA